MARLPAGLGGLARFEARDHLGDPGATMRANCGVFFRIVDGRIAEQHTFDCFDPF